MKSRPLLTRFISIMFPCSRNAVRSATQLSLYDFLAPSLIQCSRPPGVVRYLSMGQRAFAGENLNESHPHPSSQTSSSDPNASSRHKSSKKPLTQAQRDFLSSALRVNQAGELAATLIYKAQTPPMVASYPHLRPLMQHMHDQEVGHFDIFNSLITKHRVRPTAMYPVWSIAASALGWGTAVMGREAAMACTEAVETEIGTHYNEQVSTLLEMARQMKEAGEELGDDLTELLKTIRRIRDEELEHLDHAVENDAKKAVPYEILTNVIRAGCRGAIWVSQKV